MGDEIRSAMKGNASLCRSTTCTSGRGIQSQMTTPVPFHMWAQPSKMVGYYPSLNGGNSIAPPVSQSSGLAPPVSHCGITTSPVSQCGSTAHPVSHCGGIAPLVSQGYSIKRLEEQCNMAIALVLWCLLNFFEHRRLSAIETEKHCLRHWPVNGCWFVG